MATPTDVFPSANLCGAYGGGSEVRDHRRSPYSIATARDVAVGGDAEHSGVLRRRRGPVKYYRVAADEYFANGQPSSGRGSVGPSVARTAHLREQEGYERVAVALPRPEQAFERQRAVCRQRNCGPTVDVGPHIEVAELDGTTPRRNSFMHRLSSGATNFGRKTKAKMANLFHSGSQDSGYGSADGVGSVAIHPLSTSFDAKAQGDTMPLLRLPSPLMANQPDPSVVFQDPFTPRGTFRGPSQTMTESASPRTSCNLIRHRGIPAVHDDRTEDTRQQIRRAALRAARPPISRPLPSIPKPLPSLPIQPRNQAAQWRPIHPAHYGWTPQDETFVITKERRAQQAAVARRTVDAVRQALAQGKYDEASVDSRFKRIAESTSDLPCSQAHARGILLAKVQRKQDERDRAFERCERRQRRLCRKESKHLERVFSRHSAALTSVMGVDRESSRAERNSTGEIMADVMRWREGWWCESELEPLAPSCLWR